MLKGTLTCTQVALLHPWIKHNYFCYVALKQAANLQEKPKQIKIGQFLSEFL